MTGTSHTNLLRMLLRYYYFGGTSLALLALPPGIKPGHRPYSGATDAGLKSAAKRRGRQPVLANELGRNDFVVLSEDIDDMVSCFRGLLAKGPAFMTTAHEDYLAGPFRRRHPAIYDEYIGGGRHEPVTIRQFRYYIDGYL